MSSPRPDGFYWVRIGAHVQVARYRGWDAESEKYGTPSGHWEVCGVEDSPRDDGSIVVLSGPLEPPK